MKAIHAQHTCAFCGLVVVYDPERKAMYHERPTCPKFAEAITEMGARQADPVMAYKIEIERKPGPEN